MNIGLALVFGVLYWLATNKLWYGTLHLVRQPLVLAVPIGLIMGNLGDANRRISADDLFRRNSSGRYTACG